MARRGRQQNKDLDRDWGVEVVASFVALIHARRGNDFADAARAQRELREHGVDVKIRQAPTREPAHV